MMSLDRFDRRILEIVQKDNQLSHGSIGELVGLSASAVRKRLTGLKDRGFIAANVAILSNDPSYIHLIITVTLETVTAGAHANVEALIEQTPEIVEAYHVAGREDFVLIMRCPSLAWYESWSLQAFVSNPDIGVFDTRVAWSRMKYTTATKLFEPNEG